MVSSYGSFLSPLQINGTVDGVSTSDGGRFPSTESVLTNGSMVPLTWNTTFTDYLLCYTIYNKDYTQTGPIVLANYKAQIVSATTMTFNWPVNINVSNAVTSPGYPLYQLTIVNGTSATAITSGNAHAFFSYGFYIRTTDTITAESSLSSSQVSLSSKISASSLVSVASASITTTTKSPMTTASGALETGVTSLSGMDSGIADARVELSSGAKAGIGIGAALTFIILAIAAMALLRRKRNNEATRLNGDGPSNWNLSVPGTYKTNRRTGWRFWRRNRSLSYPGISEIQGSPVMSHGNFVEVSGHQKLVFTHVPMVPKELDGSPISPVDRSRELPSTPPRTSERPARKSLRGSGTIGGGSRSADEMTGVEGEEERVMILRMKIERVKEERKIMTLAKLQELEEMEAELEKTLRGAVR